MGPIAAPHDLIGRSLNDGAHEGGRVRIGAADTRVAVRARDLGPVAAGLQPVGEGAKVRMLVALVGHGP